MKVVIGIGDSWTQGEGGVPMSFFERGGGRVNEIRDDDDLEFLEEEHKNSWVNVLCKKYFKDHKPFNLGMRGYGNRGAVKNLYYHDVPYEEITEGYLIFLLSSRERFDYIGDRALPNGRRRFMTLYPQTHNKIYRYYAENIYSEFASNQDLMFNIIEAQTFAKTHNLKFYFGYAFDNASDVKGDPYKLSNFIEWDNCLTPNFTYLDILCAKEGITFDAQYLIDQPWPLTYLTNCCHPTIKGYEVIADYMYKNIVNGPTKQERKQPLI